MTHCTRLIRRQSRTAWKQHKRTTQTTIVESPPFRNAAK
ncbi:hypothetical protein [Azospirillum largimobile]